MTQAVYSEDNFRVLLFYVILPLTVVLLIFFIGTKIYSAFRKNKDINSTNYAINYWTNVLGVLVTSILLSVSIGFALSFTQTVRDLNAVEENAFLYYFFMVFPIIPFIFLIVYIRKFIVNMKRKEKLDELDKDVEEENTNEE